ncbi:hypothetical protein [Escherichia coli]|uniref:hypothetical protein n=1 Tax=Escherichia coli TaxID=562 RepID=UPI003890FDBE
MIAIGSGAIGRNDRYGLAFLAGEALQALRSMKHLVTHNDSALFIASVIALAGNIPAVIYHLSAKRRTMENAKMNSLIAQYPLVKDLVALKKPLGSILGHDLIG